MSGLTDRNETRRQDVARVESPFDGWPTTRFMRAANGGIAGIIIEPVVMTPLRAKFAQFLAFASTFTTMAVALGTAYASDAEWYWWYMALGAPIILAGILHEIYRIVFQARCRLVFTPEHFAVQRGGGRTVLYDRQEPHRFRLDARHANAREEAERHEKLVMQARMRGRFVRPVKYHTDCLHLMLDYHGQPRKVMEIMGQEEALLVLARVKLVDEFMERMMAMGNATAKGAQSDWDDMPGKIPAKV